jgi:hypothetical protein
LIEASSPAPQPVERNRHHGLPHPPHQLCGRFLRQEGGEVLQERKAASVFAEEDSRTRDTLVPVPERGARHLEIIPRLPATLAQRLLWPHGNPAFHTAGSHVGRAQASQQSHGALRREIEAAARGRGRKTKWRKLAAASRNASETVTSRIARPASPVVRRGSARLRVQDVDRRNRLANLQHGPRMTHPAARDLAIPLPGQAGSVWMW